MKEILKSKRGEGSIDVAVSIVVIMMLVALVLNVFSFLTLKQDMDYFARELVKTAEICGDTDAGAVWNRYEELAYEVGFYPDIEWDAYYYDDCRIQYGDSFRLIISYEAELLGMGVIHIPLTLIASSSGISRQYWK